jgi:two-component system, NtrC family, sensor histidine kinase AtoS
MLSRVWPTTQRNPSISLTGLEDILDNLNLSALLIDRNERILAVNIFATEASGYKSDEIFKENLKVLFPYLIGQENSIRALQDLPHQSLETILLTKEHRRLPVTLNCSNISGSDNHCLITFELIAERQRQQTQKQYRSRLITNIERLFSVANQENPIEHILNVGSQMLIANSISVYICENDTPVFRKSVSWGGESIFPNEITPSDLQHLLEPSLWINGKRSVVTMLHQAVRVARYAYLATAPIGEPGAWAGVIVATGLEEPDTEHTLPTLKILAMMITAHLQQRGQVKYLKEQLNNTTHRITIGESIRETISEGVILVSPENKVLELNNAAEYILGYVGHEIYGQPIENVLIGTDRIPPAIKLALQGIPTPNLGKVKLHRRDGSLFAALIHTTPAIQNEKVLGALVILQDISEHEQIKTRTQQLEQRALLGEVTAVFAHEVRNPINNISTGLQLMALNTPEEDTETQELISRLQQDCNRLTSLMESILTFSRTGNYKFIPLKIQSVLERLLTRWRPRLERLNIKHHVQVAPNTLPIMGDQRALEQVFTNLISNAVHAMGKNGGTLAIKIGPELSPSGKNITQIDISDTGPGIPDEIRDHIFDPFFTTNPNGTGLGLSITKQIVTAHRGTIAPISFPGGTIFRVQLPALEASEEINI